MPPGLLRRSWREIAALRPPPRNDDLAPPSNFESDSTRAGIDSRSALSYISVMTEIADTTKRLPAAVQEFVLRWGDMGGQWGVNRSVAQIQALLYLADRPLTAEDIAEQLGLARSNVSNSIRELITWKLVRRVPMLGDRRDHYEAEADLWQVLTKIAQGRKEREIDPAVAAIRKALEAADGDPAISRVARARLHEMRSFLGTMDTWFSQMLTVPPATLMRLIKLGSRVVNLLSLVRGKSQGGRG
jgi:DNA-binding transcriptional regulator GbsR (MarR family)